MSVTAHTRTWSRAIVCVSLTVCDRVFHTWSRAIVCVIDCVLYACALVWRHMHMCTHIFTFAQVYVCACVCTCAHSCLSAHVCEYSCVGRHTHVGRNPHVLCMYACVHLCLCLWEGTCTHVSIHICICPCRRAPVCASRKDPGGSLCVHRCAWPWLQCVCLHVSITCICPLTAHMCVLCVHVAGLAAVFLEESCAWTLLP